MASTIIPNPAAALAMFPAILTLADYVHDEPADAEFKTNIRAKAMLRAAWALVQKSAQPDDGDDVRADVAAECAVMTMVEEMTIPEPDWETVYPLIAEACSLLGNDWPKAVFVESLAAA